MPRATMKQRTWQLDSRGKEEFVDSDHHIALRVGMKVVNERSNSARGHEVITIQVADHLTRCLLQSTVPCARGTRSSRRRRHENIRRLLGDASRQLCAPVGAAVIDEYQLDTRVVLVEHTLDAIGQPMNFVVYGNDDRDRCIVRQRTYPHARRQLVSPINRATLRSILRTYAHNPGVNARQ